MSYASVRLRLVLVAVLSLVLGACADDGEAEGGQGEEGQGDEADTVTFSLPWLPESYSSIYYVGVEQGWFEEENIDLEITRGFGSGDTIQRVATGDVDIAQADLAALVPLRINEDIPVVAVASIFAEPFHAVFFRTDDAIEEPPDLEGRSIACSPGSALMLMFPAFAEATGTDADAVEWQLTEPAATLPAFTSGQTDAVCFPAGEAPFLEDQSEDDVDYFSYAEHGVSGHSQMIVVTEALTQENPDLVERFNRALQRSLEYAVENPEESIDIMLDQEPDLNPDVMHANWEATLDLGLMTNEDTDRHGLGHISADGMEAAFDSIVEASDLDPGEYTVEDLYTTQFLP